MRAAPDCALDDEIVTIRPQPAVTMSGIAAWMQWNVPVRLTASMRSQASSVISVKDRNSSSPALVTTISIGPRSVRTLAIASSTAARSETSTDAPERRRDRSCASAAAAVDGGVAVEVEQRDAVSLRRQSLRHRRDPCPMRRR